MRILSVALVLLILALANISRAGTLPPQWEHDKGVFSPTFQGTFGCSGKKVDRVKEVGPLTVILASGGEGKAILEIFGWSLPGHFLRTPSSPGGLESFVVHARERTFRAHLGGTINSRGRMKGVFTFHDSKSGCLLAGTIRGF